MKYEIITFAIAFVVTYVSAISIPQYETQHLHEPIQKSPPIPILKHDYQFQKDGYHFSFETGNGIHHEETGTVKNFGDKKHESIVKQGTVTYHDEHGHPITLTYTADEHGFQAHGDHLPTPPPIPEEILKSLQTHAELHEHAHAHEHEQIHLQQPIDHEQQYQYQYQ